MLLYWVSMPRCRQWGVAAVSVRRGQGCLLPDTASSSGPSRTQLSPSARPLWESIFKNGPKKPPPKRWTERGERNKEYLMCVTIHPNCKAYHSRTENLNSVAFSLFLICTAAPFRKAALLYERYY